MSLKRRLCRQQDVNAMEGMHRAEAESLLLALESPDCRLPVVDQRRCSACCAAAFDHFARSAALFKRPTDDGRFNTFGRTPAHVSRGIAATESQGRRTANVFSAIRPPNADNSTRRRHQRPSCDPLIGVAGRLVHTGGGVAQGASVPVGRSGCPTAHKPERCLEWSQGVTSHVGEARACRA